MKVFINGKEVKVDPNKAKGKGGEADVYDIGWGKVLKLFKQPNHPDYAMMPLEQKAAEARIAEHQKKLPAFPKNLPAKVIVPEYLATDSRGEIVGYSMSFVPKADPLKMYADQGFRQKGVKPNDVLSVFKDMHATVSGIHQGSVVVGDFNDLNILVSDKQAFFIDADSYQFGQFICRLFTEHFADPMLCDPKGNSLSLIKKHNEQSDWYAYTVMLMECLLFVGPYGGIYKPKNVKNKINHGARPLHRITVFHPDVQYPKPATPYDVLPDDVLQHFHKVFEKDWRGLFPLPLIEVMSWTKCSACGTEHARSQCPRCAAPAPTAMKQIIVVKGKVKATKVFTTTGDILFATFQNGRLRYIYHENDAFKREDKQIIIVGDLDPHMRFRVQDNSTIISMGAKSVVFNTDHTQESLDADLYADRLPMFDANSQSKYWLRNGHLLRDGEYGPVRIGDVLENQTMFWAGEKLGFGFYRAGEISVFFLFNPIIGNGINDSLKLPRITGQLIDAACIFSSDIAWFSITEQRGAKIVNRCHAIKADGTLLGTAEAEAKTEGWLGRIRGKCAIGNFLLAATDDGIVRVGVDNGKLIETSRFPDTEAFVDSGSHLFPGKDGVFVVDRREIKFLQIS